MPLRKRLVSALLALIEKERYGMQIDTTLVQGVVYSFVTLGFSTNAQTDAVNLDFYRTEFESAFLTATEMYYTAESSQFIATNQVSDYMQKVESRIKEEEKRVRTYMHADTMDPLMKLIEKVLIDKHKDQIWLEFPVILDRDSVADLGRKSDRLEDLTRMYNLLSRVARGTDPLKDALEKHVATIGAQAIEAVATSAAQDPTQYVTVLLNVHHKYNTLVIDAFKSDASFTSSLDKACRVFINDNAVTRTEGPGKSPELIAKYCDLLLKKSPKNPEEQETLEILNGVMLVFKYLEDKDVFQTFYSKMLAKRLIHGTSSSDYLEGQMISKLKQNCGQEYTSKLARMFADIGLSKDIQDRFLDTSAGKALTVDFTVLVLATGSWPLSNSTTNFSIPRELAPAEASFTTYYQREFSGRKLSWLHQISKGEVKARFTAESKPAYILQCSTYQIGVLLQFNDHTEITAEDLQVATQLNDAALRSTVLSLVKTSVLKMTPDDESTITKSHTFSVNTGFKNKKNRVMVNVPIREAQAKDSAETQKYIEEGRRNEVQAAIVRIMKRSKQLSHSNLISDVISQVQNRFRPQVPFIKKCIDLLIEKEFLERVENEKDVYAYKA